MIEPHRHRHRKPLYQQKKKKTLVFGVVKMSWIQRRQDDAIAIQGGWAGSVSYTTVMQGWQKGSGTKTKT